MEINTNEQEVSYRFLGLTYFQSATTKRQPS